MKIKNNDITYEYRKKRVVPRFTLSHCELVDCKEEVLNQDFGQLKDGRFYHTTDTNKFFYDWKGTRYELNIFGSGVISEPIIINNGESNNNGGGTSNGIVNESQSQYVTVGETDANHQQTLSVKLGSFSVEPTYNQDGIQITPQQQMVPGLATVEDIESIILENEEITAAAYTQLDSRIKDLEDNIGLVWKTTLPTPPEESED